MRRPSVTIISDGSCWNQHPGGGWAAILRYHHDNGGVTEKVITGRTDDMVTNIVMEMQAVIGGLSALTRSCEVTLITDLEPLARGINEWLPGWAKRRWRNPQGKTIKNVELWKQIYQLMQFHVVKAQHVKGHTGHEFNEKADTLAGAARLGTLHGSVEFHGEQ